MYNKQQTVNEEAEKQTKTEFYIPITKMNVVDVWVWFGDDRVLLWFCRHKRSWKYKIKNKMNLDVRPQCILVNHKAAVQSFLMKLRFQNSEPDSLTLSDAQR